MDQAKSPSVSVVAVEGNVVLVDAQGNSRALNSGEFVGSGDVIVTPANGSFSLNTDYNQFHSVAGDSAVFFNFDPHEDGLVLAEVDVGDQSNAIDVIQQLIAEGRDPTELLEESAAGEQILGSGFSPFINIARSTRFVLAEAGFDTSIEDGAVENAVEFLGEDDLLIDAGDTTAPGKPVVVVPEATKGINAAELADGAQAEVALSTGTKAGDTITLIVTGPDGRSEQINHTIAPEEATAGQADVTIPPTALQPDGEYNVVAEITDEAGNTSTPSDPVNISVDTTAPAAVVTLDENITPDDIINAAEAATNITITGTTGDDVVAGDTVTLTINGTVYTGLVAADNSFSISVAGTDLAADPDMIIEASVTTTDTAGNSASATDTESYSVDTTAPPAPAITINEDVNDDGFISISEFDGDVNVTVKLPGSAVQPGDILTVNGTEITLTQSQIDAGEVLTTVAPPAEGGTVTVTATITDPAGNTSPPATSSAVRDTLINPVIADLSPVTDSVVDFFGFQLGSHDDDGTVDKELLFISGDDQAFSQDEGTTITYYAYATHRDGVTTYRYQLDDSNLAVQGLNDGETLTESFNYTLTDGNGDTSAARLTITINGTNDSATVSSASETLTETNAPLTTSGTLTSSDVDNVDNTFTAASVVGTIGTFSIDAAGAWTFTANSTFDSLNVGDSVNETFNVSSVDGTPGTVTITISGSNDAATVSSASETLTETNTPLTTGGTLTSSDVDNTDNAFTAATVVGTIGTFSINAAGAWTFTANSTFNSLNVGDGVNETFNVSSVDGTPSTVTITINGTNDAPIVTDATANTGENTALNASVPVATDVDGTINANGYALVTDVTQGSLTFNANGSYSFNPGSYFDDLIVGESRDVTFTYTYTATDNDGAVSAPATVTITVNGADDGVTISNLTAAASGGDVSVDEADLGTAAASKSGTFTITALDGLGDVSIGGTKVIEDGALTAATVTTGSGNMVARLGGDEFTVLLPDTQSAKLAGETAQRIIQALSRPFAIQENSIFIGASIGISLAPEHAANSTDLIKYADIAMYSAKSLGRNTYQFYSTQLSSQISFRQQLNTALHKAIANDELYLRFQPLLFNHRVVGVEALLRWNHPEMGEVSPAEFISVAEENSLIGDLTHWVLDNALKTLSVLRKKTPDLYVAVNVSARDCYASDRLIEQVQTCLRRYSLPGKALELEITENTYLHDIAAVSQLLAELKALEIRIAIDDFGTGFSSLTYLLSLPLDTLKIDQSFIKDIHIDKARLGVVRGILAIAESLNMQCLAEGVESPQQLEQLLQMGCHRFQGYLFSPPISATEFAERF